MRPSAQFKNRNRVSYCLHDAFVPLEMSSADALVIFTGTPPFRLSLSITSLATSQTDVKIIETSEPSWKIDLPSYIFTSMGPHLVTMDSVEDASNCPHAALDPLASSFYIDVAETAAIFPLDRREHFCVGEIAQFTLEGKPPWTIG